MDVFVAETCIYVVLARLIFHSTPVLQASSVRCTIMTNDSSLSAVSGKDHIYGIMLYGRILFQANR
jgi:hypothetical protein